MNGATTRPNAYDCSITGTNLGAFAYVHDGASAVFFGGFVKSGSVGTTGAGGTISNYSLAVG
jgi:hypothetical protein